MSKNTVKARLTRKRDKRVVENYEYDKFTRRILAAYARRVAAGDVEFLRCLASLTSDVDTVTRDAVRGLRTFGYSWSEIADRLGVSRQAAQMRYGERAERNALDRRLLEAGLGVSVATLVEVFADHYPGWPLPDTCPGCGYEYPLRAVFADCASAAVARELLYRRRTEDPRVLERLTPDQYADLHDRKTSRATPANAATAPWGHRSTRGQAWEPVAMVPITNNGSGGQHDA